MTSSVMPRLSASLALTAVAAAAAPSLKPSKYLHASELGAVAISNDGTEVAVALGRSLTLDSSHQVCRRMRCMDFACVRVRARTCMPAPCGCWKASVHARLLWDIRAFEPAPAPAGHTSAIHLRLAAHAPTAP